MGLGPRGVMNAGAEGHVCLLGGFRWIRHGDEVQVGPAGQRLTAFLALRRRPTPRAVVAGMLWPEADETHAAASLRTELWKLGKCESPVWLGADGRLGLHPGVTCDVHDAIDLARRILDGQDCPSPEDVERSLLEDILPEWSDEWIAMERVRFHQLRLHALEALIEQYVHQRHFAAAVQLGLSAVEADPYRESSRRALIAAYLGEGNVHSAIGEYRTFETLLANELAAEPTTDLRALIAGATVHRPALV